MHVLWINEEASPVGGCERYISDTVTLLRKQGVRSTLLYNPQRSADPVFLRAFDGAFPLVDLTIQLPELNADLIYVHHLEDAGILAALRRTPVPKALFVHDYKLFCLRENKYRTLGHHTCTRTVGLGCYPCLGFLNRSDAWPGFKLARVGSLLARQRQHMFFDAVVTGSRYMADHIVAHGFERARVHAIPLYATQPSEAPPCERERDLILFVGQLIRGKGLDVLLHAMPALRQRARLMVAGSGRQEEMFRSLCEQLGLGSRVQFAGRLRPEDLAGLYRRAALVVVPSRYPETFGLVGVEAMSHGAPVVGTTVGAIGEWLEDGRTGLAVPPNDSSALAGAIDRVLADANLARDLGAGGLRRYQEWFRPERHVDTLLALFATLQKSRA